MKNLVLSYEQMLFHMKNCVRIFLNMKHMFCMGKQIVRMTTKQVSMRKKHIGPYGNIFSLKKHNFSYENAHVLIRTNVFT